MNLLHRSHSAHQPSSPKAAKDQTVVSALLSDNFQSPNAIPPRTSSSTALLNGEQHQRQQQQQQQQNQQQQSTAKPSKRASTSVLRPISETDWLSQGRRVSQEVLRKQNRHSLGGPSLSTSPPQRMAVSGRDAGPNALADTMSGASRERGFSDSYGSPKSSGGGSGGAMGAGVYHKLHTIDIPPQRKSSRHKPVSSMESNKSSGGAGGSGATPLNASQRSPLSPAPPVEQLPSFTDDLIHQRKQPWSPDKEKILLGPYAYLLGHPGKDIRAQLIAAFNEWLRVPEQSLSVITRVIGMLHTASLLVDDVEDSSLLRRGVPVAHSIFGTAQTINSANYVYFLALQELTALPSASAAIHIYTSELLNLHRGQGLDLFWRDTLTCPSEPDYLAMVNDKTGGLFRLAIRLMQAESSVSIDCVPLVNTIGLLFQVLDDHLNLSSALYTARKGLCEDLTEGKFSFPVIHAIRADPHNLTLLNILRQKTTDEEVKRYAVQYMERMGSFRYSRDVLDQLRARAEQEVSELEARMGVEHPESGMRGAESMRKILERLKVET